MTDGLIFFEDYNYLKLMWEPALFCRFGYRQ